MTRIDLYCALGGFWLSYVIGQMITPRVPSAWEIVGVTALNCAFVCIYLVARKKQANSRKVWCKIFGHKWLYVESIYAGELNGRMCENCPAEEGERNPI